MDLFLELLDVAFRSIVSIAFLFIITRVMGKKQISQLTFFDYIIGISIGSIAAAIASTNEIPYLHGLTGMLCYAAVSLIISIVTNKSLWARRFFTGKTFLLIDNGKILEKNLSKVRYDINDLLAQARTAGYFDIADVSYALMETDGKISFMPTAEKQPITTGDLKIPTKSPSLTANVIIDGVLMEENLKMIGLNFEWLKAELKANHENPISEILLATVDGDNKLSVYNKTKKLVKKTPID